MIIKQPTPDGEMEGRNGTAYMTAIRAVIAGETAYIEGVSSRGRPIRGGMTLALADLTAWAKQIVEAYEDH